MNAGDVWSVAPELILAGGGVLVLLADAFVPTAKRAFTGLALAATAVAAWAALALVPAGPNFCGLVQETTIPTTTSPLRAAVPGLSRELGAGDGRLMLRLAHRAPRAWPTIELTFLDRQPLIDAATCAQFGRLGWVARSLITDVLEWLRAPAPGAAGHWDVIVTNLFLHHFDERELPALMSAIAGRCDAFLACEPRRALLALAGSHLMGFIGASSITRHDAVLSVRAGFRGQELSSIWPDGQAGWHLQEQERGLFSHLFQAVRDTTALPTVA